MDEFIVKGRDMNVHSPVWGLRDLLLNSHINTIADDWLHVFSD
ncbi:MAG TPA: hypothetical protein PLQ76_04510 [bacterium]|nr:hypothetical protein [bacterium]